jgi:hypothetical protein
MAPASRICSIVTITTPWDARTLFRSGTAAAMVVNDRFNNVDHQKDDTYQVCCFVLDYCTFVQEQAELFVTVLNFMADSVMICVEDWSNPNSAVSTNKINVQSLPKFYVKHKRKRQLLRKTGTKEAKKSIGTLSHTCYVGVASKMHK